MCTEGEVGQDSLRALLIHRTLATSEEYGAFPEQVLKVSSSALSLSLAGRGKGCFHFIKGLSLSEQQLRLQTQAAHQRKEERGICIPTHSITEDPKPLLRLILSNSEWQGKAPRGKNHN